jgi:hypothetical protein
MSKPQRYRSGVSEPKRARRQCSIGCAASTRTIGTLSGSLPSQWIARHILRFHGQMLIVLGSWRKRRKTPHDLSLVRRRMRESTK